MSDCPLTAWNSYVASLPWSRGFLDDSTYKAGLRGASLGIDPERVFAEACERIRQAGDAPRVGKINAQLRRAYAYAQAGRSEFTFRTTPVVKPRFDPERARQFAGQIAEISMDWLTQRSAVPVKDLGPSEFLSCLYEPGEKVLVFDVYRSGGQALWRHGVNLDRFRKGRREGVWFLAQPVDGLYHDNPRLGYKSRRSEENVTAWRYAVLECDCQAPEQWLRILVQLPLPICAVYTSGGRSIHALVRIDATSKQHWDRIVRQGMLPHLVPLGADPGALTAVRLTRLPGCRREEKNAEQRLLYLAPSHRSQASIWRRAHE